MIYRKNRCENCRFLSNWHDDVKGECRRYPPQVIWALDEEDSFFPKVFISEWCGEFKEKEKE